MTDLIGPELMLAKYRLYVIEKLQVADLEAEEKIALLEEWAGMTGDVLPEWAKRRVVAAPEE